MRYRTSTAFVLAAALSPVAAHAEVLVRSELPGFRIAATQTLPRPSNASSLEEGGFCVNLAIKPSTRAGKHAAQTGWNVTSEEQLAGYTAVGIFSRGASATSGTCLVNDGNVVLYRNNVPVAIVYQPPHGDEPGDIGGVVRKLSPDRLRISDFTPAGFETADLKLGPNLIAVVPIASRETACGDLTIPNLRRMTIPQARKALTPFGWRPDGNPTAADGNAHDAATSYRKSGLTEFETCSGTGYGFCAVRYAHPGGAVLSVTTMGDDSTVSSYGVQCPKAR